MLMKKKVILFIIIWVISATSYSQQNRSNDTLPFRNQVLFEAFGPGSLFSINYETKFLPFFKSNFSQKARFRIGIGGIPFNLLGPSCNSGALATLPVGVSYIFGKGIHHVEVGGGFVLTFIPGMTKVYCPDFDHGFFSEETTTYTYVLIGYRLQSINKKKPVFRAFISPLFPFKIWGGASVGIQL